MVAAQEELARPLVAAVLEDLVAKEASGVLEVMGIPSGVIYLDGGDIVYARASWVPGLAARLRAITPSLSGTAEPRPGQDADDAESARLAVRHGYLTTAGLHELIASVVAEAFLVLTVTLAPDSFVAGLRFTPTTTGLTDLFPRLGVDTVCREATRRAERMAAYGLGPTTAVAPRDLAAPSAVLTREQWAVACQIGDRATARELAMRRGASLSDTVHCLGSLVRAGLCVPVWAGPRGHAAAAPGSAPSAARGPDPSAASGPASSVASGPGPSAASGTASSAAPGPEPSAARGPEPSAASGTAQPAAPASGLPAPGFPAERLAVRTRKPVWLRPPASRGQPPSAELLRQVLNGLRKLS